MIFLAKTVSEKIVPFTKFNLLKSFFGHMSNFLLCCHFWPKKTSFWSKWVFFDAFGQKNGFLGQKWRHRSKLDIRWPKIFLNRLNSVNWTIFPNIYGLKGIQNNQNWPFRSHLAKKTSFCAKYDVICPN